MNEESSNATTPETKVEKTTTIPTLEVGIGTVIAAVANQIPDHPGIRVALTSAAPIIGLGCAFLFRLGTSLLLRQITIIGAKKTCNEITEELKSTSINKARRRELEKQLDEARSTLKGLRTDKIKLDIN